MKTLLVLMILTSSLYAQDIAHLSGSGNRLVLQCATALRYTDNASVFTAGERMDLGYCLGLVRGVTETLVLLNKIEPNPQGGVRLVQKYLHDHPEELVNPDTVLVFRALTEAFPRPKRTDNRNVK